MPETDVQVKNASIIIKLADDGTAEDVRLTVRFQGLADVEKAKRLRQRLEDLADEFSGQTKLT